MDKKKKRRANRLSNKLYGRKPRLFCIRIETENGFVKRIITGVASYKLSM